MIALSAFRLLPPAVQVGIACGIAALVIGAAGGIGLHIYNKGWHAAIAAIAAQDKEAVDAADQARMRVDSCRNAGGVWDTSRGQCSGR